MQTVGSHPSLDDRPQEASEQAHLPSTVSSLWCCSALLCLANLLLSYDSVGRAVRTAVQNLEFGLNVGTVNEAGKGRVRLGVSPEPGF